MSLPQMDTEKLELMTAVRCDYVRLSRQAGKEPHWEVIEVRVLEAVRKLEIERAEAQAVQPYHDIGQMLAETAYKIGQIFDAFMEGWTDGGARG